MTSTKSWPGDVFVVDAKLEDYDSVVGELDHGACASAYSRLEKMRCAGRGAVLQSCG